MGGKQALKWAAGDIQHLMGAVLFVQATPMARSVFTTQAVPITEAQGKTRLRLGM